MDDVRTFIAIRIFPRQELITLLQKLKKELEDEELKWIKRSHFHLTVKFLGEISADKLQAVKEALKHLEPEFKSFTLTLKGTGVFMSRRKPRVLYVKIEESADLKNLAVKTGEILLPLGFDHGKGKFSPHLTLARVKYLKETERFLDIVNKYEKKEIQKIDVEEMILFQSILGKEGPEYIPLLKIRSNENDHLAQR